MNHRAEFSSIIMRLLNSVTMNKKVFYLLIIACLSYAGVSAQKSFMKYGNIPDEDLRMTVYPEDTTAAAVILGDFGVTLFNISEDQGFFLNFTRHTRVKILKKSALDWADFSIGLYLGESGEKEDITMIKGTTYNLEDGKVVKQKLDRNAIFTDLEDKNHQITKFTMPNVKVGSVIDVTYTVESPFTFTLNSWYFQNEIPVRKSVYCVNIPEYYNYKNWTSGYVPIQKESDTRRETFQFMQSAKIDPGIEGGRQSGSMVSFAAQVTHWVYTAENVPAFINEPYITTRFDYLSAVEFELMSTNFPGSINKYYTRKWDDINRELMDDSDFGKQLDNSGHLKDQIAKINSQTSDPKEKMIQAYEYIKKSIAWDSRYRKWPTQTIRKAYNDGEGSSSDINLNLVAMCRALGLDANPVLVSTRSNGKIKPGQVILTQFNHVVAAVKIGDMMYVLDAINPYCPYTILPPNTLNGKGMMVSEKGYQWVDLYSQTPDIRNCFVQLSLDTEMQFHGQMQKSYQNYSAVDERKYIRSFTDSTEYAKKKEQKISGLTIEQILIENLDSIYKPLKIREQISLNDRVMTGGDRIYFNPVLFDRLTENPFKNDERKFPVDYNYPNQYKSITLIDIPEGYSIEELPRPIAISLPENEGRYIYNINSTGNTIRLSIELTINQTIYPSTNYAEIKKFYEMMVAKEAEQIVLKAPSI
jgi:transglutaminase-like putative cysteine protease